MEQNYPKAFAIKHRDEDVRLESRSGGVFTAISDAVLQEGGVVYGCVLNDRFEAEHVRATTVDERDAMRGSKYIPSRMGDCFRQVEADLKNGKKVLFSGTACQIAGLKSFLRKEYEGFLSVNIVCHGVPSPVVWEKYLKWISSRYGGDVVKADFRNKKDFGWAAHVESIWVKKRKRVKQVDSRVFRNLFFGHLALRPACYQCPYRSCEFTSDLTIADYWGINKAAPGFNDNKGVSLVLVNTERGERYLRDVAPQLVMRETLLKDSLQKALVENPERPSGRDTFWRDFETQDFGSLVNRYAPYGIKERLKDKIKKIIYAQKRSKRSSH